jgi:hypothetical protein
VNSVRLRRFHVLFGIVLTLAAVPLLLLAAVIYIFWGLLLRFLVIVLWIPRGLRVLVVYSNSPHWKQRFEERVLPQLGPRCVVLNWSERRRWSWGLAECLFWFYGGAKNYNPLAVVIPPFGRAKVFRFWPAFRDAKHGRPESLQQLETEFLNEAVRQLP